MVYKFHQQSSLCCAAAPAFAACRFICSNQFWVVAYKHTPASWFALFSGLSFAADSFTPAILLEAFVREVGASLKCVTDFELNLQVTSECYSMTADVDDALVVILRVCNSLTSFRFSGFLSLTLFLSMVETSKHLSARSITYAGGRFWLNAILMQSASQQRRMERLSVPPSLRTVERLETLPAAGTQPAPHAIVENLADDESEDRHIEVGAISGPSCMKT